MNNPILTTRKTSNGKFIKDRIGIVIGIVVGFFISRYFFNMAEKAEELWRFSDARDIRSAGVSLIIAIIVISALEFVYYYMQFQTYADVYQDRIVGKGMEKIVMQSSFDLRFDQIVDISQNNGFLNVGSGKSVFLVIKTAGGSYQISTTSDRAKEIMEFYRKNKR